LFLLDLTFRREVPFLSAAKDGDESALSVGMDAFQAFDLIEALFESLIQDESIHHNLGAGTTISP